MNSILNPHADPKTGGVVSPFTAIQYMIRLNMKDQRILSKIEKELSVVTLKNFNLYFTALAKLFPERGDIIFQSLYNFRNTPAIVVDFLKILRAENSGELIKSVRAARQKNPLSLTTTQKIQGLFLDEWLEKQLPQVMKKASGLTCEGLF